MYVSSPAEKLGPITVTGVASARSRGFPLASTVGVAVGDGGGAVVVCATGSSGLANVPPR